MEALQIVVITVNCARWKTDKKGAASSASDPTPRRGSVSQQWDSNGITGKGDERLATIPYFL